MSNTIYNQQYTCSICLLIMDKPTTTLCGHIFCKSCITKSIKIYKKCPLCNTRINIKSGLKARKDIQKMMHKIEIKCENTFCEYYGTLKCMREHSLNCFQKLEKLQFKACKRFQQNEQAIPEITTTFFDIDFFNPFAFSSGLCLTIQQDPFISQTREVILQE